jgi:hypothetical protein
MTEIDSALWEVEIRERHAALTRQMVAVVIIICLLLILVGLHL